MTDPINESLFMKEGSNFEPIATSPPGFTLSTMPAPVAKEAIFEIMGSYLFFFSLYMPGSISISFPVSNSP